MKGPTPRAYRLLWDAHSLAGVVLGLALFVTFASGAFALYRGELHRWADPALRTASTRVRSMDALVGPVLAERPPKPGGDVLVVWPFGNRPYVYVGYEDVRGTQVSEWVAPATGARLRAPGRSAMPDLLNDLHFYHQLGTPGQLLAGAVAAFALVVLASGLLIHWRRLPARLHAFRPAAPGAARERMTDWVRTGVADAHAVLGVLGLPFTAVFAVTGAFFSLLVVVYGAVVAGTLGGDPSRLDGLVAGIEAPAYRASGRAAPVLPLDTLVARLPAEWPPLDLVSVHVTGWGDAAATAQFEGSVPRTVGKTGVAVLGAATGRVFAARGPARTPPLTATVVSFGTLHFARFGGPVGNAALKLGAFVLALAAAAVTLTGNWLWLAARRPAGGDRAPRLHRALGRLTAGVGTGFAAAVPALFLATRLVPLGAAGRTTVEQGAFFGAWALLAAAAFAGPSARAVVRWQLALAGVLGLLVPVANGAGTGAWPWVSGAAGEWAVAGVDLGFAAGGVALLVVTSRLRNGPGDASRGR